jgi:hypothetical protein
VLDDQGFESWQRQEGFCFFKMNIPALGARPAAYSMSTWVKRRKREADYSPRFSSEVKNE